MNEDTATFDPAWEAKYRDNPAYRNRYPWSCIVSFVMSWAPRDRPRADVHVLEVGCGAGNNLWFCAREGFASAGIDGSASAIDYAKDRFAQEGLRADLRVGDFGALPFASHSFDLCIDHAALSHTTSDGVRRAIAEIHRVLKPGGLFFLNLYSDRSSSFDRLPDADGVLRNISKGSIVGGAQAAFYGAAEIRGLLSQGWRIKQLRHVEEMEMSTPDRMVHGEWQAIAARED